MKLQTAAAALLAVAGFTLSAAPQIKNNIIDFGNAKVFCAKNGDIIVSNAKGVISRTCCHCSVVNPAAKKTAWIHARPEREGFRKKA